MSHEERIRALPIFRGDVSIEPIAGGITNRNYRVEDATGRYVVRLGSDIPVHQIMRFNEVAASRAACAAGLSPAVRHAGDGVLVLDYIESRTLTPADIRDEAMLERVLPLVARCHRDMPKFIRGPVLIFWVFHVVRDYAGTLADGASRHLPRLPALLEAMERLEAAAGPHDIVFGQNDLLAANFLDDGDRLWLVDWDYAGFNTPLFDLGGLASNNELSEPQERWLLEQYFERPLEDGLWQRYQAMKCASLLRETMWSMVSEIHSDLDFDYRAYTAENLARFERAYDAFREL